MTRLATAALLLAPAFAGSGTIPPPAMPMRADSAAIAVVIANATTRTLLEGVEIRVGGIEKPFLTDYVGEVTFFRPQRSRLDLKIRRVGYAPIDTSFDIGNVEWMHITLLLETRVQSLPATTVEDKAPLRSHLAAFEARRAQKRGRYITPAELQSASDKRLVDLLERIPGITLDLSSGASVKVMSRTGPTSFVEGGSPTYDQISGRDSSKAAPVSRMPTRKPGQNPGYCEIGVWIDGMYMKDPEIGTYRAAGFDAVEFYTASNTPPEFRRSGTCGVLLLWSR